MPSDAATLEARAVAIEPRGLTVPLPSGEAYFNAHWLRDADPTAFDPQTGERVLDISGIEGGPVAKAARIEGDALVIDWAGEEHTTRLPLSLLETVARHGRVPDPADLPRRLWGAGHHPRFVRADAAEVERSGEARLAFARALIEDGVAMVTGMEATDEALTRLAETLGPVTPTVDGSCFDVRLEIAPTNLAFTARALEMHTDLPNEEAAPGVQFLHCRANTVEGGASLFVDGAAVAEALREEDRAAFDLLASHDVPFFRRFEGRDHRSHQRVIELDRWGAVSGVTISQHLQDALDLPQRLLDDWYPAFCRLIRMMKDDRFVNRFRLEAGTCAVFDNHRVVHGREAFSAESGQRHLRGCYVDRGALRSTYRVLSRPRRGGLGPLPDDRADRPLRSRRAPPAGPRAPPRMGALPACPSPWPPRRCRRRRAPPGRR